MEWYEVTETDQLETPGLLFYPERIRQNIQKTIDLAGGAHKLWPHVKTYKTPEIVRMQMMAGILRFKCATIAEAEMVATCNPKAILLAYPLRGSGIRRLLRLAEAFEQIEWGLLVDSEDGLQELEGNTNTNVYIDLDVGMHRTGAEPSNATALATKIVEKGLKFAGLHAYDGHIHTSDEHEREALCSKVNATIRSIQDELKGLQLETCVVGGGSPTFPFHIETFDYVSPGTTPLWDAGYSRNFPDLPFIPAAAVAARVVSKPKEGYLTLDAGYKAVASEMQQPRLLFPQFDAVEVMNHSEEHLVIRTPMAESLKPGDICYGIPWHICPTVSLYDQANVVDANEITGSWDIEARKRKITY